MCSSSSPAKKNHLLGKFDLGGIAPAPRGQPQIEVTFEVDQNGILNVAAEDKQRGTSQSITVRNDEGRLSQEQIDRMIQEEKDFAREDRAAKERVDAKLAFEGYIHSIRAAVESSGSGEAGARGLRGRLEAEEAETLTEALKDAQQWLDLHPEADAEEIRGKQQAVEGVCTPIVSKYYGAAGPADGHGEEEEEEEAHDEL